jgi:hypothetical protein
VDSICDCIEDIRHHDKPLDECRLENFFYPIFLRKKGNVRINVAKKKLESSSLWVGALTTFPKRASIPGKSFLPICSP